MVSRLVRATSRIVDANPLVSFVGNSALELEPYLLKAILRRARCKFELNDFNGCRDDLSIAEHHRDIGPSGRHFLLAAITLPCPQGQ